MTEPVVHVAIELDFRVSRSPGTVTVDAYSRAYTPERWARVGWITADCVGRFTPLGPEKKPVIVDVFVTRELRRRGIATALLKAIRAELPETVHGSERTREGQAWALSTGDGLPPWKPIAW